MAVDSTGCEMSGENPSGSRRTRWATCVKCIHIVLCMVRSVHSYPSRASRRASFSSYSAARCVNSGAIDPAEGGKGGRSSPTLWVLGPWSGDRHLWGFFFSFFFFWPASCEVRSTWIEAVTCPKWTISTSCWMISGWSMMSISPHGRRRAAFRNPNISLA